VLFIFDVVNFIVYIFIRYKVLLYILELIFFWGFSNNIGVLKTRIVKFTLLLFLCVCLTEQYKFYFSVYCNNLINLS
jgi:hypothetical protein